MKIKSLLLCNASFKIGSQRIVLPAAPAILELDDSIFSSFIPRLGALVLEEGAKWIKRPVLSEEDQAEADAKELAKAKAVIAAAEKKATTKPAAK